MRNVEDKIRRALGQTPVDLLIQNARLVNVVSGEVHDADVAVVDGRIAGFGHYQAAQVIDIKGSYLAPSFIDGHIHIESTMLTVPEFARAVVPHGTGAVIADPHEFANVLGLDGIRYVLEQREQLPIDVFVMLPSCVPATELESSGARLSAYDLRLLIGEPRVAGIGEMMNYPGVLAGDPEVLDKLHAGRDKRIDGHAPGLAGHALNAYVLAGARSDHECTTLDEAREKLRRGMHIHLREGSSEHNLLDLLPLVTPQNAHHFSFVTDDRSPASLLAEGHIDNNVRLAIGGGLDPLTALRIATIATAEFYNLRNTGAIIPRYWADMVVFDDLKNPVPRMVFKKGALVAQDGQALFAAKDADHAFIRGTMNVARLSDNSFLIPARGRQLRVMQIIPGQIGTKCLVADALIERGHAVPDTARDLVKLAVIERHRATGNIGLGFVSGFGLQHGALASSVAHDSHNLCALGTSDGDMLRAAQRVIELGGGQVVASGGEILAELALPVAGLVSDQPLEAVAAKAAGLSQAARQAGCTLSDPFAVLSFLSLVPIPELRLTDKGLVDATTFRFVDLFVQ
jgi:adenine deaminase